VKTVREIIRLFNLNLSVGNIALSCNISISTVSFYANLFKASGADFRQQQKRQQQKRQQR